MSTRELGSLQEIIPNYNIFILDLWGVIHDGQRLYPGVVDALAELKRQNKKILFLSNAPRRAIEVVKAMENMGLPRSAYDDIITSGEACFLHLKQQNKPGSAYLYIGLEKDRKTLDGLDYRETNDASEAAFLLCAHSMYDNQPMEELLPTLKDAVTHKLPMLCINPDIEVVRQTGERVYCAGVIAKEYEKLGGQVIYYGKPHPLVYEICLGLVRGVDKKQVVAIGDSLSHDIKGGNAQGIDTVLVTGGILKERIKTEKLDEICEAAGVWPKYAMNSLII